MKNSLTIRLYTLLSLAVILVVIVGFMSLFSVEQQTKDGQKVEHTYEVIAQINEVRYWLIQMRGYRRATGISKQNHFKTEYAKASTQILPALRNVYQLTLDNPVQGKLVQELQDSIASITNFWMNEGQLDTNISPEAFANITNDEEKRLKRTYDILSGMRREEMRLLFIRREENHASVSQSNVIIVTGVTILLVLVLVLINTVLGAFKSRYKAGLRLQGSVDELARVNALTEEKNWLLIGLSQITSALQDARSLQDVGQKIITGVVEYIHLPAGAFYMYDDERKKLKLLASYSLPKDRATVMALGEGLVGSAARQHELVLTKNVPIEYWQISSSTGFGAAGEIVCLPLWLGNELKGVLELCSFGSFSQQELDLLRSISNNLVVALNSKMVSENESKLLSQVQFQKEFLEQQQNTLKRTNEELQTKTATLLKSQEDLRIQEENLRRTNAELEERNEAVEVARQTLSQKAAELEAASRYKSEFLANMSHELRTPLNSVLVLARLLEENKLGNLTERQMEYARVIHNSGNDLLTLINDILDLSKIEAGRVEMHFEQVRLSSVMNNMHSLFEALAQEKQVEYRIENETGMAETLLVTDQLRVEQIVKNLLSNAFKFTPKGGKVTLKAETCTRSKPGQPGVEEAMVKLEVTDTGIGIPKEKQQLIFEAFHQADGSTSRRYGGTGLGLSISRELVQMLGGEVKVESEEGRGSKFSLLLPLDAVATVPGSEPVLKGELATLLAGPVTRQNIIEDDTQKLSADLPLAVIVEDDIHFARSLLGFAHKRGFQAIIAIQGDEALWCIEKYRPQVVLLDLQLPVIDGFGIMRYMKQQPHLQNIPMHVISGAQEIDAAAKGPFTYLKKPARKEDLEALFQHLAGGVTNAQRNILMVSTAAGETDLMKLLQQQRHLQITQARTHVVARELARDHHYHALLADLGTNGEQGVQLLQKLTHEPLLRDLPILVYYDAAIGEQWLTQIRKMNANSIAYTDEAKDKLLQQVDGFLNEAISLTPASSLAPEQHAVAPLPASPEAEPRKQDLRKLNGRRVLIADDDMRNIFVLSTLLEEFQCEITSATNGREALEMLRHAKQLPHLVLMDVMMPEMDGLETTRLIREDQRLKHLPVVAITAKAMQGDKEKCLEAGATEYLTKPLERDKLVQTLASLL